MNDKPPTQGGYSSEQLDVVTGTCLYVFTKLGDLLDDDVVVVVGGLAPYLFWVCHWGVLTFHYNGRMSNIRLSPEQWARVLDFLRGCTGLYIGQEADCRRFVEAVLWINRSGAQWRLLPAEYGNWNTVYKRFAR